MTNEYAQRLHRGWSKEFLMEVFGLSEAEYLEIFGKCEEIDVDNEQVRFSMAWVYEFDELRARSRRCVMSCYVAPPRQKSMLLEGHTPLFTWRTKSKGLS